MIERIVLEKLYKQGLSLHEIADKHGISCSQVVYWARKYNLPRRSHSEATYLKRNPAGDPFRLRHAYSVKDAFLEGLGLGLYWGEGNKKNREAIRLGNTNARLVKKFIEFLTRNYQIDKKRLRFGVQIFSDTSPELALQYWQKELGFPQSHFQKVVVTRARSIGTYKEKSKYGVLTVYYCNKKLRDIINHKIENL